MPKAFATGYMVGLIEWACLLCIKPHLDEGEGSLGVVVADAFGLTVVFYLLAASMPIANVLVWFLPHHRPAAPRADAA